MDEGFVSTVPPTISSALPFTRTPPPYGVANLSGVMSYDYKDVGANLSSYCVSSFLLGFSSWYQSNDLTSISDPYDPYAPGYEPPNPEPPCCGICTVYIDKVQLLYWPTPGPSPPITMSTDTDGFTLYEQLDRIPSPNGLEH